MDLKVLSEVEFFENEDEYYSFDYDPVTRFKKWTRAYGAWGEEEAAYRAVKCEVSIWRRLRRMLFSFVFFGLVFFFFAYVTAWNDAQTFWRDHEGGPVWVWWLRVLTFYAFVAWPVILGFLTARRIMRSWVLSELHRPAQIMHFNETQSWLLVFFCIVWFHFCLFSLDAEWLYRLAHYLGEKNGLFLTVLRPWIHC
ncbi:MAG: hypothetical protein IJJ26_09410 [Victivallales bacterium]|nr:hypothetical protein [Victivallales bacterium]